MHIRLLIGALLLGFGLLLGGCSRSGLGPEGDVSGKVTYNGKPLPGGQVTFMTSKGYGFNGIIDSEGNYKARPLVGEARIVVDNSMLAKGFESSGDLRKRMLMKSNPNSKSKVEEKKSSAPAITGTYVPLPQKYRSPETSGLTYTVKSGSQIYNIELSGNP